MHNKARTENSVRNRLARIEALIQSSPLDKTPSLATTQPEPATQIQQAFTPDLSFIHDPPIDQPKAGQDFSVSSGASPGWTSHGTGFNSGQLANAPSTYSSHTAALYKSIGTPPYLKGLSPVSPAQGKSMADTDAIESESHEADHNGASKIRIWEYHGPGSWLAICSEPGMAWISERTGCADFAKSAQTLTTAWNRSWRKSHPSLLPNSDEPDFETAWTYTTSFFDHCFEAVFGIVHRPSFEARLRAFLRQGPDTPPDKDIAWYALRNTVYASGCRQLLLKNRSKPYAESQAYAFQYFNRALSVHMDLVYGPPTLDGVRALAAMAFFADGVGNQSFEYGVCANAVCLAHAGGLHRQPSKTLQLSADEVLHRNWLFWAIYCCEKQVAFHAGRPSFIDDANISCEIPDQAPAGSTINVPFFKHAIKVNQFTSQIQGRLLSVAALRQDASAFIHAIEGLSEQIEIWRKNMSDLWEVGKPIVKDQLPSTILPLHIIYLHYAYYAGIQAVYNVFTCPWLTAILNIEKQPWYLHQVAAKTQQVAQASRALIFIFKSMELDAGLPPWATFYYPMAAVASLFVFLLQTPASLTAQSDIALLDVAAGHFSHMEYLTGMELGAPFARKAAQLAREAMNKAKRQVVARMSSVPPRQDSEVDASTVLLHQASSPPAHRSWTSHTDDASQAESFNVDQFDYEGWNLYSMDITDDWLTGNDALDFSRFPHQ